MELKDAVKYVDSFNVEEFLEVIDNWHGNYDGNKIQFAIYNLIKYSLPYNRYTFVVSLSASGNDDFMLVKSYIFEGTLEEFKIFYTDTISKEYEVIKSQKQRSIDWFLKLGFEDI